MHLIILSIFISLLSQSAFGSLPAPSVHDIPGLDGASLEVRFTNPSCSLHSYEEDVFSNNGDLLKAKPEGIYCRGSKDFLDSFNWTHSPRTKLIEWVNDPETKEIFFVFQTITDGGVLGAICEAIKERNIPVTFVLSRNRVRNDDGDMDPLIDMNKTPIVETNSTKGKFSSVMKKLTQCDLPVGANQPVGILRGHTGTSESNSIGWAHNKYFVVNPRDGDTMKFATGSGNLTAVGVSSNHENWLFFENIPQKSYLAQSTRCMMEMQLDDRAHIGRKEFTKMNNQCLADIDPKLKLAEGIESFFVPGDGQEAIDKYLVPAFSQARKITAATHLLGFPSLFVRGMSCAASKNPASSCFQKKSTVPGFKGLEGGADVRLITDDDMHWIMVGQTDDDGRVGYNSPWEADLVESAGNAGVKLKFMQTAHHGKFKQLHHNKIILFEEMDEDAVWTGAGNLTGTAMYSNFENYFYITIPSVVEAYKEQMNAMWDEMATDAGDMPELDVVPGN